MTTKASPKSPAISHLAQEAHLSVIYQFNAIDQAGAMRCETEVLSASLLPLARKGLLAAGALLT